MQVEFSAGNSWRMQLLLALPDPGDARRIYRFLSVFFPLTEFKFRAFESRWSLLFIIIIIIIIIILVPLYISLETECSQFTPLSMNQWIGHNWNSVFILKEFQFYWINTENMNRENITIVHERMTGERLTWTKSQLSTWVLRQKVDNVWFVINEQRSPTRINKNFMSNDCKKLRTLEVGSK
jgi:hypothetical protein